MPVIQTLTLTVIKFLNCIAQVHTHLIIRSQAIEGEILLLILQNIAKTN